MAEDLGTATTGAALEILSVPVLRLLPILSALQHRELYSAVFSWQRQGCSLHLLCPSALCWALCSFSVNGCSVWWKRGKEKHPIPYQDLTNRNHSCSTSLSDGFCLSKMKLRFQQTSPNSVVPVEQMTSDNC